MKSLKSLCTKFKTDILKNDIGLLLAALFLLSVMFAFGYFLGSINYFLTHN